MTDKPTLVFADQVRVGMTVRMPVVTDWSEPFVVAQMRTDGRDVWILGATVDGGEPVKNQTGVNVAYLVLSAPSVEPDKLLDGRFT